MAVSALLQTLSKKMAYLTQRSSVIGDNIANANTPGFKPKDLADFATTLEQTSSSPAGGVQMAVTNARHLSGSGSKGGTFKTETGKDVYEVKPTGNAVVLEQQMTKLAQTSSDYAAVAGFYRKIASLIKMSTSHQ